MQCVTLKEAHGLVCNLILQGEAVIINNLSSVCYWELGKDVHFNLN